MGTLLIYILKSAVCLAVFYLFYKLLMSRETFHRFNRFSLLGLMIICSIIPFAKISMDTPDETVQVEISMDESLMMPVMVDENIATEASDISTMEYITTFAAIIYITGILFFAVKEILQFIKVLNITHKGKEEDISLYVKDNTGNIRLIVTDENISPFSWMNHIVISRTDLEENGREILCHEMAHITNHHSIDLVLADICILLQWFNPASWLIKSELQNVHEFEADETVIRNGIDAKNYQLLLIKKAVGSRLYSIANSFNHSKLKKRITMMMKKKSSPWARAKYLYVLPLAAVAVAAFAHPEISKLSDEISSVKVNDFSAITKNHEVENTYSKPNGLILVKGTVVDDATGKAIRGASILERGTTNGTISDENGDFTLRTTENSVIIISFIGKQTYTFIASEMEIKGLKNNPIKLKDDVQNMDEIVVVGYEPAEQPKKEEKVQQKAGNEEEVFIVVEQMPEFPGGMSECLKYIARNIKYPTLAQEAKIEGRVIVRFVVGIDGYTSNFEILHSVCPALDAEAIRVLAQMPKWKPGMQRGVAVPVKYTVPVTFKLEKQNTPQTQTIKSNPVMPGNVSFNKSLENVLIVIDEKVASQQEFSALKPQNIESIHVIKEENKAQEIFRKYGVFDKKEGVIIIKTKVWNEEPTVTLSVDKMDNKIAKIIKDKLINDYKK
ncbi:M56 family metallopeptidase [Bacteroides sp. ET336]|uniref:M56 family metallopeptidase n=1 Tax=Bacteroides sp. ET336 TaxID=2972459 RepID=UPI0021ABF7E4|nr:M56 family metallopeptidase [Bacteroides sp. ET336]MCR8893920.1 M56 family metallopeptidase [Bacteroides sp. ET336]MDN0058417.1 TonB family protein [Bacteroides caecigallinarum]